MSKQDGNDGDGFNSGFVCITANQPNNFKAKSNRTVLRKQAMDTYLRGEEGISTKSQSPAKGNQPRLTDSKEAANDEAALAAEPDHLGRQWNDGGEIALWQATARIDADDGNSGIIARIICACIESLTYFAKSTSTPQCDRNILRRCAKLLKLWANGHGTWDGKLDHVLDRSRNLRHTTLSILSPLCKVLSNGFRKQMMDSNDTVATRLRFETAQFHSQTKWLISGPEESASDSDSDSDTSGSDDDAAQPSYLAEAVRAHLDCLLDLSNALEYPAEDPEENEDRPSALQVGQRPAHDYHTDLIRAKFPEIQIALAECLGKISWDRYQRMQKERDRNAMALVASATEEQVDVEAVAKSQFANSEFQDSGLGTSLPPGPATEYAETIISYMTSMTGGKRIQIPPLSAEAKAGAKFECNACGKHIFAQNNREWRKHLYLDLQPYTCFYPNCSFSSMPFADRQLWSNHLELDHHFGPNWESVQCPLCLEATEAGKSKILIHFARHMEDIALAALPREVESDAESNAGSDDDSNLSSARDEAPSPSHDDKVTFTPLVSPAVSPLDFRSQDPETVPGAYFSPLTSPELRAQSDHHADRMAATSASIIDNDQPTIERETMRKGTTNNSVPGKDLQHSIYCNLLRKENGVLVNLGTARCDLVRTRINSSTGDHMMAFTAKGDATKTLLCIEAKDQGTFWKEEPATIGWHAEYGRAMMMQFPYSEHRDIIWNFLDVVRGLKPASDLLPREEACSHGEYSNGLCTKCGQHDSERQNRLNDGSPSAKRQQPVLEVLRDHEHGVDRCPVCTWELEGGSCQQCGLVFDESGKVSWTDSFTGFSDMDDEPEHDTEKLHTYWSAEEQQNFREYVRQYGKSWTTIAQKLGTKTSEMVKALYFRSVQNGDTELEQMAEDAPIYNATTAYAAGSEAFHRPLPDPPRQQSTVTAPPVATHERKLFAAEPLMGMAPSLSTMDPKEQARARPGPSSYWSVSELGDFDKNVAYFGTDWLAISNHMGTKTHTMVKNQYLRLTEQGRSDLEQVAMDADARRARGERMGPAPTPTPAPKRRYESTQIEYGRSDLEQVAIEADARQDRRRMGPAPTPSPAPSIQASTPALGSIQLPDSTIDEEEPSTIKCICGFADDDGNTALCEKCDTWQHIVCYYESFQLVPDVHECIDCLPRPMDSEAASDRQRQRREARKIAARKLRPKTATKNSKERNSDDDVMDDSHARSLLAHCIHKDPENMTEKELEQVLAIPPRSSPIWKKADKALKGFRRLQKIEQEADTIFGVQTSPVVNIDSEGANLRPSRKAKTTISSASPAPFDPTGQTAPPGVKARVTATLWEDEGTLVFQVEPPGAGVCVARREDTHMINGTKLLDCAGMTRGRRDGILKSEKTRHVVRIGPMHLKGVWIPFERALEFANKERITDALYPLFVHNIGALLYHPSNAPRTGPSNAMLSNSAMDAGRGEQIRTETAGTSNLLRLPPLKSEETTHEHYMNQRVWANDKESLSRLLPTFDSPNHPLPPAEATYHDSTRMGSTAADTGPAPPTESMYAHLSLHPIGLGGDGYTPGQFAAQSSVSLFNDGQFNSGGQPPTIFPEYANPTVGASPQMSGNTRGPFPMADDFAEWLFSDPELNPSGQQPMSYPEGANPTVGSSSETSYPAQRSEDNAGTVPALYNSPFQRRPASLPPQSPTAGSPTESLEVFPSAPPGLYRAPSRDEQGVAKRRRELVFDTP